MSKIFLGGLLTPMLYVKLQDAHGGSLASMDNLIQANGKKLGPYLNPWADTTLSLGSALETTMK